MSNEQAIYELLVGQKIFSGGKWHVFDEAGNELTDKGGVLWRGAPGALLMWPHVAPLTQYEAKQGAGPGRHHFLERTSRHSDEHAYDADRVAERLQSVIINGKAYDPFTPGLVEILEAAAKLPEPDNLPEIERQERKLARTFTVKAGDRTIEVPLFRPMLREMPSLTGAWSYDFEDYAAKVETERREERKRILLLLTASDWP